MAEKAPPAGSDEPLVAKIAAAMAEAGRVTKSEMADEGRARYKYASAEAILEAVRGPLLQRGVILTPDPHTFTEEQITSKAGTKGTRVVIDVRFTFTDGRDELVRNWRGEGQDYGDKAYGKAYTNALKTFIRSAWLLPTEHDDPEGSPAGERAATPARAELPAWAKPAAPDAAQDAADALAELVGADAAESLLEAVRGAAGGIPAIVNRTLLGVAARVKAAAAAAAQDAAAEQPPDDEPPGDDDVDAAVRAARAAAADPLAGTVELVNLPNDPAKRLAAWKAAGCTCPDPLAAPLGLDDNCPIAAHGIPF